MTKGQAENNENLREKILETVQGPGCRNSHDGADWFKVWVAQAVADKSSPVPEIRKDAIFNLENKLRDRGIRDFKAREIRAHMTWGQISALALDLKGRTPKPSASMSVVELQEIRSMARGLPEMIAALEKEARSLGVAV